MVDRSGGGGGSKRNNRPPGKRQRWRWVRPLGLELVGWYSGLAGRALKLSLKPHSAWNVRHRKAVKLMSPPGDGKTVMLYVHVHVHVATYSTFTFSDILLHQ